MNDASRGARPTRRRAAAGRVSPGGGSASAIEAPAVLASLLSPLLERFLETAPAAAWIKDERGRYLYVNRFYAMRFGAEPEALLGSTDAEYFGESTGQRFRASDIVALRDGETPALLEETVERDGTTSIWLKRKFAFEDASGRRLVAGTSVEITEHERAREALDRQKAVLTAALSAMSDAVTVTDAEGRFVLVNPATVSFHRFADASQCPGSQAAANAIIAVLDPDSGEPVPPSQRAVERALRGEMVTEQHYLLERRDTGERWHASYSFGPVRDAAGAVIGAVIVRRDITVARLTEAALRESERRLRRTQSLAGLGGWRWDEAERRMWWSEEMFHLFRRDPGRGPPADLDEACDHLRTADALRVRSAVRIAFSEDVPIDCEVDVLDANGEPRQLLLRGVMERDPGGRVVAVEGIARDVSAERRLEQMAAQRRHDLEQLMHREVALQTVAAIAHELNQPLSALLAYSEAALQLLDVDPLDKNLRRAVQGCRDQAARAAVSLRDLVNPLHLGEEKTAPFDLEVVLSDALAEVRRAAHAHVDALVHLRGVIPPVEGRRLLTGKAVVNLLRNGLEAMAHLPPGEQRLSLRLEPWASGAMVCLSVTDPGPGPEAGQIPRLFQPSLSTKRGSMGVGLAITRSIIEAQGGEVWHEPHAGPGTTFRLTLPVAIPAPQGTASAADPPGVT